MPDPRDDRRPIADVLDEAQASLDRVEPVDLEAEAAAGALIVDMRPVHQRETHGHLPGAVIIDRNVLEWRLDPASPDRIPEVTGHDQRMVLVCHEGYSSSLAAVSLRELGIHRATDLIGGYLALVDKGLV